MTPETPPQASTLRRVLLLVMTLLVIAVMGQALVNSWTEPQVATRLELYQTDLLLQASVWDGADLPPEQSALLRQNLVGKTPLQDAQAAYETVRKTAIATLNASTETASSDQDDVAVRPSTRLQAAQQQQADLVNLVDLRLGILQAEQGNVDDAIATWRDLQTRVTPDSNPWQTAELLAALWQGQPPDDRAAAVLTQTLDGWFENRALAKLYLETGELEALAQLNAAEIQTAERRVATLAAVGAAPAMGSLVGLGVLLTIGIQRLIQGKDAPIAHNADRRWQTPWTGIIIWQVIVGGFLFLGQIAMPLLISPLGGILASFGSRGRAFYALLYYVLMAAGSISVLVFSIRRYRPLPEGWFQFRRGNWLAWGAGGYFAALPLMLVVALVNQQLWQGQGGSNPLLQTVLEEQDPIALGMFFFTAAIAAPLFEEVLFRGFLLPSLTRYVPVGGAIVLSALIFAIAHLSVSEVLPLTMLGMVLGVVYTRSRNLLAPMLLHSAWNSVTMLGLLLLGTAT